MKKMIIILMALLMVGLVIAGVGNLLPKKDKDIELPKEKKDKLERAGLTSYDVPELKCNENECNKININVKGVVNADFKIKPYWMNCTEYDSDNITCIKETKVLHTNEQLADKVAKEESKIIERIILRQTIKEEAEENKTGKVAGGKRSIKEKKI